MDKRSAGLLARSFEIRYEFDELKKGLSLPKNVKYQFNLDTANWLVEPKNGTAFNKGEAAELLKQAKALAKEYIEIYNTKVIQ